MTLFDMPEQSGRVVGEPGFRVRARRADPETSHEATVQASQNLTAKQQIVLSVLRELGPVTDEQIDSHYEISREYYPVIFPAQSPSGLRTRRAELVAQGLVVHDGFGVTSSGNRARIWRAV